MTGPDDGPRVVPVYALTGGRTRSAGRDLPWETLVTSTPAGLAALGRLRFEQAHIIRMCRRPVSVAEVSANLGVPVGVARVLVSDLYADGMLMVHLPTLNDRGRPGTEILERLLTGLRSRS
jgi:hypothetical protein